MTNVEIFSPSSVLYEEHMGREPIFNVWDNNSGVFSVIKDRIESGQVSIDGALRTANGFFESPDPAIVKTGTHIYRVCMWKDPSVADEWMTKAPVLLSHPHARIRHSAIWNLRTASWQNARLGAVGLEFAQKGLKDKDPGVQRASMWAHGDFVVNDPNLFSPAYDSLSQFLEENPKESNYLFALERFFRSLKAVHGNGPRFLDAVSRMRKASDGYPGLRARSAVLLDDNLSTSELETDMVLVSKKYRKAVSNTNLDNIPTDKSFIFTAKDFQDTKTFTRGIQDLKLMKYLVWLSEDLNEPFEILAQTLTDKRDGDLARSASVIMNDCTIRKPDDLDIPAVKAVQSFFEQSDIDGSQIIVQLILDPVRHASHASQKEVGAVMPTLHKYAANGSVSFTLGNY